MKKMTSAQMKAQGRIDAINEELDGLRGNSWHCAKHSEEYDKIWDRIFNLQHEKEMMESIVLNGAPSFA